MAEVVNLRMARKRRSRADKAKAASAARARHGTGKAEKLSHEVDEARARSIVDGARLEKDD
ncbi:DUF4169 family protein [Aurantiacibacter gilvus]|uniref:DUF4169 family protein n=1 Tax=Aurantiacibacter gilvus TaxID=3139141 RepID=A0ABU9IEY9_9SPHN